jgi:competence ComEA-like helix-hairpin-helix protein
MRSRLKQYLDSWSFTPAERAVVLTLAGTFVLGLGIRLFRGDAAGGPAFDYAAFDAEFAARSAAAASPDRGALPGSGTGEAAPTDGFGGAARDAGGNSSRDGGTSLKTIPRVDLNRASKRDLMRLPGIGEVTAGKIIRYREERGGFGSVGELLRVSGIGPKKLAKIVPHCYVEK